MGVVARIRLMLPFVAVNCAHCSMVATLDVCRDPDIVVGIITGTGRAFCAGADLKRLITLSNGARGVEDEWDREYIDTIPDVFLRTTDVRKPLIAAVNGFAVAGGTFPGAVTCITSTLLSVAL